MNDEEFAFFNQQLAAMLRDGIPLEGALRRLSADMRQGALRAELEQLAADLARGTPLRQAARARALPELYCQLLEIGQVGNDLPAVLTLAADYHQRRHLVWTRLKGLMVYPVIVLVCAFGLSLFLSLVLWTFVRHDVLGELLGSSPGNLAAQFIGLWLSPALLGLAAALAVAAVTAPGWRRRLRWRLPAFKEASLAQVGAAMSLMLKSGAPLPEALALLEKLEAGTPAGRELTAWRQKLSDGRGRFADIVAGGKVFPPLFVWVVAHAGEDLGAGFQTAGELYQARAAHRIEMLLYAALPCAVLALGLMILTQISPGLLQLLRLIRAIGNF